MSYLNIFFCGRQALRARLAQRGGRQLRAKKERRAQARSHRSSALRTPLPLGFI